jgi:hypothetical protein
MKNKITKGIALSFIAILIMGCQTKKEEATPEVAVVDTEQIKTELQAMEDTYADAMNTGTTDAWVYYADDAISYGQEEAPQVGKATIHAKLKSDSEEARANGRKVKYTTNEVHVSSDGNQLVEIGSYRSADSTNTKVYTGNYMALYEKKDGKYVCIRDMGASDQPKKEEKK